RVIPDLLRDCIKKGVKGAIIEASGFEEVGNAGEQEDMCSLNNAYSL
ncbi:unnamed protein product, partial [marine sediment metagenome]